MTRISIQWVALLLAAACSGCAGDRAMRSMMDSWVGAPVDELVGQWGPPTRALGAGTTLFYSWDEVSSIPSPATPASASAISQGFLGNTSSPMAGVDDVETACERTATVDARRVIVEMSWTGVTCPLSETGHEHWRRKAS